MAENTAGEIYVNKFLGPNPFLRGEAARLPVIRQRRYLQATLSFPDAAGGKWRLWEAEKGRHVPAFSNRYLDFTSKRGIAWYPHTRRISSTEIMGDATKASAEKGARIRAIMIAHLVSLVEDIKGMTLAEIHQP
jgi:hypothetical protein